MSTDIEERNTKRKPSGASREILLSFWKVHILHHAGEQPIHGQWLLTELRRHGYEISPGTLYPLLHRMQRNGWLRSRKAPRAGPRARTDYRLTPEGQAVLAQVRERLKELYEEVAQ
jgi:PadR family transcriptional regulator, regulatory protein PadR